MLGAVAFGLLIGLVMGMVGGGGAVLAVPALVYVVGLGVHEATTVSLAVVAAAAATGAIGQARRGAVCWSSAAWLSAAAVLGGIVGALANRALGGAVLLLIFSAVMVVAARATWQRAGAAATAAQGCPDASPKELTVTGTGIGALTGLVGVGGGFVVVPALVVRLSFGMREAMATSMAIVAIVSTSGLLAHLATGSSLDLPVAAAMGGAAIVGALLGPRLADRVSTRLLGRSFAVLVVLVAIGVAVSTLAGAGV
ncbi:MAG: sulfite exporter TauE/SafE family protein [Solirubrobacterales bacterium]